VSSIPVTVVTGFLGAGTTTLVNRWLADAARGDIAVVVNEHGDVGVDGELLEARAKALREITGGCICCRTQAELVRALDELASSGASRVLVETSGAASPAGILRTIAGGGPSGSFALDGVVTVVDGTRIDSVVEHDLAVEQIGYADIVVLSRADTGSAEALERARGYVAARNGAARIVEGARGDVVTPSPVGLEALLAARRGDFEREPVTPSGAPHVYESMSLVLEGEIDGDRFAAFVETELARAAGRIFRTKGILAVTGLAERMIVQGVADLVEVTFGEPWADRPRRSRLVVVGFGLDRAALERGFAACAAQPAADGFRGKT
jgi:G3E family GTPase